MVVGIDPGYGGAIAVLSADRTELQVFDMPILKSAKGHVIDGWTLAHVIHRMKNEADYSGEKVSVFIESVSAMPGQGVASMFNFGRGFGVVEGVLMSAGIQINYVSPQRWKSKAGLLRLEKDVSRIKAKQLYPQAELHLKKHTGRADAILIAHFAPF